MRKWLVLVLVLAISVIVGGCSTCKNYSGSPYLTFSYKVIDDSECGWTPGSGELCLTIENGTYLSIFELNTGSKSGKTSGIYNTKLGYCDDTKYVINIIDKNRLKHIFDLLDFGSDFTKYGALIPIDSIKELFEDYDPCGSDSFKIDDDELDFKKKFNIADRVILEFDKK